MAETRRCIGSATFGIEAHDAPVEDFPVQPSRKDGLGRMCKTHWNQYTTALRKAALEREAAAAPSASVDPDEPPKDDAAEAPPKKRSGSRRERGPALDGGGQSPD